MSQATSKFPNVQTRHKGGISDPVKHDHRELEDYYHKILDAKNEDDKTRWANQFTWELARHSVGEELIMYPRMREVLKDGDALVEKDLREHQEVNMLSDLFLFFVLCMSILKCQHGGVSLIRFENGAFIFFVGLNKSLLDLEYDANIYIYILIPSLSFIYI